jgi:membrane-associated phospholipid phosphatase
VNPVRPHQRAACLLTNALNPFFVFTALYALVAFSEAGALQAALYVGTEIVAAALVAGYVFLLRRQRRVGDFWISARHQRLVPALVLLSAFVTLLGALVLLEAPGILFWTTLSMGLASAAVAATTLVWKASAHSAVAGHAAAAGLLVLGPLGVVFALVLPAVLWSRVASGAHTLSQTLAGAGVGAAFALAFLA